MALSIGMCNRLVHQYESKRRGITRVKAILAKGLNISRGQVGLLPSRCAAVWWGSDEEIIDYGKWQRKSTEDAREVKKCR